GLFVWRGAEMEPHGIKSEFLWKAPDGTAMLAVYFLSSYRNAMRLAERSSIMAGRIRSEAMKIEPFAGTPHVLLMNGYDQEMVPDDILPYLNDKAGDFGDFHVRQSTPEEYIEAVKEGQPELPVLTGALYSGRYISVFPGILSSRMYLKIQNDLCQRKLEKYAEPLATVVSCLGGKYHREDLVEVWKLLLKNHPHDSICGVSIDDVHTDMEERLAETERSANRLIAANLTQLTALIDTGKYEAAIGSFVVVNPSLRRRDGLIRLKDQFPVAISIRDHSGRTLPWQRDGQGGLIIGLTGIPALGYETFFMLPEPVGSQVIANPAAAVTVDTEANTIENSLLKIRIRPDGSLDVTDKKSGAAYHGLGVFEDGADAGDEYNYSYPEQDLIITSKNRQAAICYQATGPLEARVRMEILLEVPEELGADRRGRSQNRRIMPIVTWLTVRAGSPLVEFRTEVRNTVKDHRLRVLFPTRLVSAYSYAETQFDVVARPIVPAKYDESIPANVKRIIVGAREPEPITIFPQRAFVDINDGRNGLAVINRGLPEYEIIPEQNTIALTLFRGVNWIARPDLLTRIGDAGPMIAVPDAQCLRTMEFNYALYVHAGDWQTAGVSGVAEEFNTDLLVVKTAPHQGPLPGRLGFFDFDVKQGIIKVTAIKRSEDGNGVIVRFHNPAESTAEAEIGSFFKINTACYTDLNEANPITLPVSAEGTIRVSAQPKQIVTVKLELDQLELVTKETASEIEMIEADFNQKTDFSRFPAIAPVTASTVEEEEARAEKLAETFAEFAEKTFAYQENMSGDNTHAQLELNKLQLEMETYRRASLEARLSAIFTKKKYLELNHATDGLYGQYLKEIVPVIREVGLELNKARISKRLLEYIVDYYENLGIMY
ncbi:MAG: alpha-mannosidase, partial [Bacteroidota bacterium]